MVTPVPKANAVLICDYVITEQNTNKKSLIGIFENINVSRFPCVHHALSVYVKMTEGQGTYEIKMELVDLKDNKTIGGGNLPNPITMTNPLATHELVFNLKGLKFAHPGEYEFRIYANENILGQKTFVVSERKKNK